MRTRALKNLGTKTLAVYLILAGLSQVVGLAFRGMGLVLGILATAAGVLLLLGK